MFDAHNLMASLNNYDYLTFCNDNQQTNYKLYED